MYTVEGLGLGYSGDSQGDIGLYGEIETETYIYIHTSFRIVTTFLNDPTWGSTGFSK